MSKIETGGPAFPVENTWCSSGMTLRDYFAAKAMRAYVRKSIDQMHDMHEDVIWGESDIAEMAYTQADAMMEARK